MMLETPNQFEDERKHELAHHHDDGNATDS